MLKTEQIHSLKAQQKQIMEKTVQGVAEHMTMVPALPRNAATLR